MRARQNMDTRGRQPVPSSNVPLRPARSSGFGGGLSVSCTALDDHLACLRRRSYAGKPSTRQYAGSAAAFRQRFVDIQVNAVIYTVFQKKHVTTFSMIN